METIGTPLSPWQKGMLDIHHINTGAGDCSFLVFPDGTTMLSDAGELDPTTERYNSPRQAAPRPNDSKRPHEWVADYIGRTVENGRIDYALLTHFHGDHLGEAHDRAPKSEKGDFRRTGFVGVCEALRPGKVIDRGYPDYDYPFSWLSPELKAAHGGEAWFARELDMIENYHAFRDWASKEGTVFERFRPGVTDQFAPREAIDGFTFRNVYANGDAWTGAGTSTRHLFPDIADLDPRQYPGENQLSCAVLIRYGPFSYFNGADISGILALDRPAWFDIETFVAQAVGPVDIQVLNHHGYRDTQNEFFTRTLRPRVFVQQNWSSDQPGHDVLSRMTSTWLYPGPRDIFSTNMLEANRMVIGEAIDRAYASTQGHIVVRVAPGGERYQVIVLEDGDPECPVKAVHDYESRSGSA